MQRTRPTTCRSVRRQIHIQLRIIYACSEPCHGTQLSLCSPQISQLEDNSKHLYNDLFSEGCDRTAEKVVSEDPVRCSLPPWIYLHRLRELDRLYHDRLNTLVIQIALTSRLASLKLIHISSPAWTLRGDMSGPCGICASAVTFRHRLLKRGLNPSSTISNNARTRIGHSRRASRA